MVLVRQRQMDFDDVRLVLEDGIGHGVEGVLKRKALVLREGAGADAA